MTDAPQQKTGLKRIGELLVESEILSDVDLAKGLEYGKKTGMAIGRVLAMLRLVSDPDLRAALHIQSVMKFESMPGHLGIKALKYMKQNGTTIEEACKQVGWQSDKFKGDVPPKLRELKDRHADVEQRLGADHPELAEVLLGLAEFYEEEEMWAHAEANCQLAIEKLEKALGPTHLKVTEALSRMGTLLFMQDRYDEAHDFYQRVLDIKYKALGSDSLEVARAMQDLAEVYEVQQKFGDAEKYYLQAIDIREKFQDIEEPELMEAVRRLSFVCGRRGRAPDPVMVGQLLSDSGLVAEEKIPEALAYSREHNMPLARALVALELLGEDALRPVLHAHLLIKSNLLPLPVAIRVLRLCSRRHIPINDSMTQLGWQVKAHRSHSIGELLGTNDELLDAEKTLPADDPEIARLCLKLADLYETYERYADAEPLYRRALSIVEKRGQHDPQLLMILDKVGLMSVKQSKFDQAESMYKRVLELRLEVLGDQHIDISSSYLHLGHMYLQKGEHQNAITYLQKSLPIAEREYGAEHASVGEIVEQLAVALYEISDYDRAEPLFWRAFKIKREYQDTQSFEVTGLLTKLADLYNKQGQYNMADSVLAMFKENKSVYI